MSKPTNIIDKLRNPRTRVYLPELLESVSDELKENNNETAISLVRAYNEKNQEHASRLRDYLQSLYHPAVKLDFPDSPPPYDNTQYVDYDFAPSTLDKAFTRIKYFVKGHSSYIERDLKRETMFIQVLESLHKNDSELFVSILLKKFPTSTYPNIGINFFEEAVPQYFTSIDVPSIARTEKVDYTNITVAPVSSEPASIASEPKPVVEVKAEPVKKVVKPKATPTKTKPKAKTPVKKPTVRKTPVKKKES